MSKNRAWTFVAALAITTAQGAWAHPGHGSMWSALYEHMTGAADQAAQPTAAPRVVAKK